MLMLPLFKNAVENSVDQYARRSVRPCPTFPTCLWWIQELLTWFGGFARTMSYRLRFRICRSFIWQNQRMAGRLANTDIWILVISVGLPGGRPRLDYVWPFLRMVEYPFVCGGNRQIHCLLMPYFNYTYLRHNSSKDSSSPTEDSAMALRAPLAMTMVNTRPHDSGTIEHLLIHFC